MTKQFAELSNLSMILLVVSILPFMGFFAYVLLRSPLFSPVYVWRAKRAYKKKSYARAAKLYERLHDLEGVRKGNMYAKKAAQSHELAGQLRVARDWYAKAADYNKVGALMVEAGQIEDAIALYQQEKMPQRLALLYENQESFLEAAAIYRELKQPRKEESMYRKATFKGDPAGAQEAKLHLARLYHQLQRVEESRRFFEEASAAIENEPALQQSSKLLKLRDDVAFLLQRLT